MLRRFIVGGFLSMLAAFGITAAVAQPAGASTPGCTKGAGRVLRHHDRPGESRDELGRVPAGGAGRPAAHRVLEQRHRPGGRLLGQPAGHLPGRRPAALRTRPRSSGRRPRSAQRVPSGALPWQNSRSYGSRSTVWPCSRPKTRAPGPQPAARRLAASLAGLDVTAGRGRAASRCTPGRSPCSGSPQPPLHTAPPRPAAGYGCRKPMPPGDIRESRPPARSRRWTRT
jgi:hypothetical protein